MNLTASLVGVVELTCKQVDAMHELMSAHYAHVGRESFDHDLAAKDWAILLHDREQGELRGFSTQVCFEHSHRGESLRVLFSGDTIIHPDYWGGMQLPVMFGRMMQAIHRESAHQRLFWMLISKGFRTYRFLPTFFHRFHPCHDRPTPDWEQSLMHALGRLRFPQAYDSTSGLIRASAHSQSLHPNLAEDRCHQTRPNPHIDYFFRRNPEHAHGDELLCLAEFNDDNLKPFILRQLNRTRVELPHARTGVRDWRAGRKNGVLECWNVGIMEYWENRILE